MTPAHKELLLDLQSFAPTAATVEALMDQIAKRLHEKMTRYNWTGFYLVDPTDANYLLVGPYAGSFSPHVRIPLDRGLCGAAASSGQVVVVVQDVSKDARYLAGSNLVKSEIVVLIYAKKKLAAELDIESYFDTFNKTEQEFVEACASVVADYLGKK